MYYESGDDEIQIRKRRRDKKTKYINWTTTEERDKLICSLYQDYGRASICKILKVSRDTVKRVLSKNNIKLRTGANIDIELINRMYSSGMTLPTIANKLNIEQELIQHHIIPEEQEKSKKISHKRQYTRSCLEKKVATILNNADINLETQFRLDGYEYDFRIKGTNILLEIHGSHWHSKRFKAEKDLLKQQLAHKHGYKLLIVWDFMVSKPNFILNKVKYAINKANINIHDCSVDETSWQNAKLLLHCYHYQSHGRSGRCYGIFYTNKLIGAVVFTDTSENKNYLELSRFVIDPQYQVENLASWALSKIIKKLKKANPLITKIITYTDSAFGHYGTIYKASNWNDDGFSTLSHWYYDYHNDRIYYRINIINEAKKLKITTTEFCHQRNLTKIVGHIRHKFSLDLK